MGETRPSKVMWLVQLAHTVTDPKRGSPFPALEATVILSIRIPLLIEVRHTAIWLPAVHLQWCE